MSYLAHHGIKNQKWGVRRFQNEDGSLTEAGRKRYGLSNAQSKALLKNHTSEYNKRNNKYFTDHMSDDQINRLAKLHKEERKAEKEGKKAENELARITEDRLIKETGAIDRSDYNLNYYNDDHFTKTWQNVLKENPELTAKMKLRDETFKKTSAESEEVAKELLGKYADKTFYDKKTKAYERLGRQLYSVMADESKKIRTTNDFVSKQDHKPKMGMTHDRELKKSQVNKLLGKGFVSKQKNRPNMGYDNDRERKNKQLQNAGIKRKTW